VLQVAARHFHQVGNQVVAALELHVDLAKGIGNAVAQFHQPVVGGDGPQHHNDHQTPARSMQLTDMLHLPFDFLEPILRTCLATGQKPTVFLGSTAPYHQAHE
jgi:hypothetical protein